MRALADGAGGYAALDWYASAKASDEPGWAPPRTDDGSTMRAAYASPFSLPSDGGARFGGVVLGSYKIAHFAYRPRRSTSPAAATPSPSAPPAISSRTRCRAGSTALDPAAACGTERARASCDRRAVFVQAATAAVAAGAHTPIDVSDPLTGETAWLTLAPVPGPGWTLATVLLKRSVLARTADQQRDLVRGGIAALLAAALILLAALLVDRATTTRLWLASPVITVAALGGIGWVWYLELATPAALSTDVSSEGFLEQVTPYRGDETRRELRGRLRPVD